MKQMNADRARWLAPIIISVFICVHLRSLAQSPPLPSKASLLRDFGELGLAPRQQGSRDTCSLFVIAALAGFECAKGISGPHVPLSEEFLIWAAKEACGKKREQAMFYEAAHGLNTFGICCETLMPYADKNDAKRKPSAEALADAKGRSGRWRVQWIKRWDIQRPLGDAELRAIKGALASGHPVACGLRWPKSLRGHELLDVPGAEQVADGHSIAFVGYEDDLRKNGGGVFLFRNSAGTHWGDNGYGVMSYAYARAYANDALWLELGPPNSEVPLERFEAESLPVLASERCDASTQDMAPRGGPLWSHAAQLLCRAQEGGSVELRLVIRRAGRYRLRALATAGPDFGEVRATLDGKPLPQTFDLYAGRVCPAGSLELGTDDLAAGQHRLRFTAERKNAASTNFFFGLDAFDLLRPSSGDTLRNAERPEDKKP